MSGCHFWEAVLLASGWEKPAKLLTRLQCTGQLPRTKNHLAPNMNTAEVASRTGGCGGTWQGVPQTVSSSVKLGKNPALPTRYQEQTLHAGSPHTHLTCISKSSPCPSPEGLESKARSLPASLAPRAVHDTILANETKGDIYPGLLGWALISC